MRFLINSTMASRRDLKKVVNDLCIQVIIECFSFLEHTPSLNQENAQIIISEALELRNRLINKINNPRINNSSLNGAAVFYRSIRNEAYLKTADLLERLDQLPR